MSDVRRVVVLDKMDLRATYDGILDDPNGTHYLVPRGEYERWQRSRVKYAPGEENELLREQITEMQAEIERLRKRIGWLSRLLKRYRRETPLGHQPHMIAHEVDDALRELEDSDE